MAAGASVHMETEFTHEWREKLLSWFKVRTYPVHKYMYSLSKFIVKQIKPIINNARKKGRLCDNERYDTMQLSLFPS